MNEIDNRERKNKKGNINITIINLSQRINNTCIVKVNTVQRKIIRIDFYSLLLLLLLLAA
jgi:hypothetical protein